MLAGISLRMRPVQKRLSAMRPVRSPSSSSFHVISQPDTTKKASTPRLPPGRRSRWKHSTAMTARARMPSSPGL